MRPISQLSCRRESQPMMMKKKKRVATPKINQVKVQMPMNLCRLKMMKSYAKVVHTSLSKGNRCGRSLP